MDTGKPNIEPMDMPTTTTTTAAPTTDDEPQHIGTNKVLLFDDHYIERKHGFTTMLRPPARDVEPVLIADEPWEVAGLVGDSNVTVMNDDGRYRMWYVVHDPRPNPAPSDVGYREQELADLDEKMRNDLLAQSRYMLCYAESNDGLHWDKPALGIIEFNGSRDNNMLLAGRLGGTVFKDPTAPPDQRYKYIHGYGPRLPHVYREEDRREEDSTDRRIFHGIYGSTSPDGIHWTVHPQPIMPWYTDTTNVAYWDDRLERYVAYVRYNQNLGFADNQTVVQQRGAEHYRAIGRSESRDFFHFPPPTKIAEPSPEERRPRATGMDYYNSAALKYPGTADAYFLFYSEFYHEQNVLDVHLATSRDGVHYQRWAAPLIGPGLAGAWDSRSIYMATGMIRPRGAHAGELWMYYHGRDHGHGEPAGRDYTGGIGRVRFRAEGFVAQEVDRAGGELLTRPLRFEGDQLRLNLDAGAGGRLKVELCDEAGQPLPGFSAHDADWLWFNDVAHLATWQGRSDLSAARPSGALRFIGQAVKLYAFQFEAGQSG